MTTWVWFGNVYYIFGPQRGVRTLSTIENKLSMFKPLLFLLQLFIPSKNTSAIVILQVIRRMFRITTSDLQKVLRVK